MAVNAPRVKASSPALGKYEGEELAFWRSPPFGSSSSSYSLPLPFFSASLFLSLSIILRVRKFQEFSSFSLISDCASSIPTPPPFPCNRAQHPVPSAAPPPSLLPSILSIPSLLFPSPPSPLPGPLPPAHSPPPPFPLPACPINSLRDTYHELRQGQRGGRRAGETERSAIVCKQLQLPMKVT